MSEETTIQCQACGTLYSDVEEVCPYCGEPQYPPEAYDEAAFSLDPLSDQEMYRNAEEAPVLDEALYVEADYSEDDYPAEIPSEPPPLPDTYEPASPFADSDEEIDPAYAEFYDDHEVLYDEDDFEGDFADDFEGDFADDFEGDFAADFEEDEDETAPRRFKWRRVMLGCLGTFICITTLYGSIGVLAAYRGLQERARDIQTEAQIHYERGQDRVTSGDLDRAIAEFERALNLNPNLLAAREALREAQRISQSQPTPTSETRSAAAAELLDKAETEAGQEQWTRVLETLSQVRDLDPAYQPERVSELLYQANYELGLQSIDPDTLDEALAYFEQALSELPGDEAARVEQMHASLYLEGLAALEQEDAEAAVEALEQIYQEEAAYLDVEELLGSAYERLGDEFAAEEAWCLAEKQYIEAISLETAGTSLRAKLEDSNDRCQDSPTPRSRRTPTLEQPSPSADRESEAAADEEPAAASADPAPTAPPTAAASAGTAPGGSIFYAFYNFNETEWQILSVPAGGGSPQVVVREGAMPAVSPNGRLLVYRSEAIESEGFHVFDLTSGADSRVTVARQHVLPRWGGDDASFIFAAQEPATNRWQIQQGFADGRSDPQILRDGRTPDLSPDNSLIAYQGVDAEGNNPGIYLTPFGGGETTRLTTHESDRSPAFSPNGAQVAYMSTQAGNWDIYVVDRAGGPPRQLTDSAGNDGLPAWSPTGTHLAYVSDRGGGWGIYTISLAGGEPVKVTAWDGQQRSDWLLSQIWWAR